MIDLPMAVAFLSMPNSIAPSSTASPPACTLETDQRIPEIPHPPVTNSPAKPLYASEGAACLSLIPRKTKQWARSG
jgi:hypothetical protein